jgi:hypothetical protein
MAVTPSILILSIGPADLIPLCAHEPPDSRRSSSTSLMQGHSKKKPSRVGMKASERTSVFTSLADVFTALACRRR